MACAEDSPAYLMMDRRPHAKWSTPTVSTKGGASTAGALRPFRGEKVCALQRLIDVRSRVAAGWKSTAAAAYGPARVAANVSSAHRSPAISRTAGPVATATAATITADAGTVARWFDQRCVLDSKTPVRTGGEAGGRWSLVGLACLVVTAQSAQGD